LLFKKSIPKVIAMASSKKNNKKETTAETRPTDWEVEELKGQVHQVKEVCYRAVLKDGKIVTGQVADRSYKTKNFLSTYNIKGMKTEEKVFDFHGGGVTRHVYNEAGKEAELYKYKKDGSLHYKSVNTYDNNGDLVEHNSRYTNGKFLNKTVYKFNSNHQYIESLQYENDKKLLHTCQFKYDERGNRTDFLLLKDDGSISTWKIYKYDENRNIIELKDLNPDGSVKELITHSYTYDRQGNLKMDGVYINRVSPWRTFEYEYDEQGNWIKKTAFYKKTPEHIFVREISYFGGPELKNPDYISEDKEIKNKFLMTMKELDEENEDQNEDDSPENENAPMETAGESTVNLEHLKWVSEGSQFEHFATHRYYLVTNGEIPSQLIYGNQNIEALALKKLLIRNMGASVIHSLRISIDEDEERLIRYTLRFPNKRYLLSGIQIQESSDNQFDLPDFISEDNENAGSVFTSPFHLFHPSDDSGKRDKNFEYLLQNYINQCSLEKMPDQPEIYMVQVEAGKFALQSHSVNDSFEIKNLDMNYGYGFKKFHEELMARFKNESKGLVLFHGEPGTGKTYYIRHLLRSMADNNKIVIYMPPNMVDHLVEPSFMSFIAQEVSNYSLDGYFCVLLIEDAEPLLAARSSETRIQGVTNLLNMTDGLLNDMLNLQIICTFNVGLKKLDKALLRPGRLLARKEFKAMSELDANILAQQLGVKHHFTKPAALSEVYALVKNKNTLIHDVDELGADVSE